jgi:hypothetical protein
VVQQFLNARRRARPQTKLNPNCMILPDPPDPGKEAERRCLARFHQALSQERSLLTALRAISADLDAQRARRRQRRKAVLVAILGWLVLGLLVGCWMVRE